MMGLAKEVSAFFNEMKEKALRSFKEIDPTGKVDEKVWSFPIGEMEVRTIRGNVFEKVGISNVNLNVILPGNNKSTTVKVFEICAHMKNPKVPIGTISLRYLISDKGRFMCHTDLSPTFPFEDDSNLYKGEMIKLSERYGKSYEEMRERLINIFMSKYRKRLRGGGLGISFETDDEGFPMVKDCGESFFGTFTQIVKKRKDEKYTAEEREKLLTSRAKWVEFNLVEDKGFIRGVELGIPPEPMILQTLPPLVRF
jgi:coproporphyrinogen III oxidase